MLLPVTGHAGTQRCAGPVTCCCYQSAAPRWKRLITGLLQVRNLTTAKSAPRIAPQERTSHQSSVRIMSMNWVELRGLEPLASCMPYKSSQLLDVAESGPTSSFSRSTSPVMAHYRCSLAPRLAPHRLLVTVSECPTARPGGPTHRGSSRSLAAHEPGSQVPRCLTAHAARGADLRGPATVAAAPRTWAAGRGDPRVPAAPRTASTRWRIQGCSDYRTAESSALRTYMTMPGSEYACSASRSSAESGTRTA
jgi:hypothetical protein